VSLWEIRAWQEITSNWHDPHRQHDAGEFLYFLGEALTSGTGVGFWQARVETGSRDAQVVDHGEMFPLILQQVGPQPHSVASRDISLQALIVAWRNQEARHAALTLPAVLPVQICRFDNRGHKIKFPVRFSAAVYMPFFPDSTACTASQRYRVAAVIYHIGDSRLHGHYRSALFWKGEVTHVTDDNTVPSQVSERDRNMIRDNAYIAVLCRDDEGDGA